MSQCVCVRVSVCINDRKVVWRIEIFTLSAGDETVN